MASAVLTCMVYVDLNPIRTGIAKELKQSLYTSVKKRIAGLKSDNYAIINDKLKPIAGKANKRATTIKQSEYLQLVEWTGKAICHPGKRSMPTHINSLLTELNVQPDNWLYQLKNLSKKQRAIGSIEKLKQRAKQLHKNWFQGQALWKALYQQTT